MQQRLDYNSWKSDSPFSSQPLRITNIKGPMITAETYSITRNSSNFREFKVSDDEEGETQLSARQKAPSKDTVQPTEADLPNGEGPFRAKDASEEKGHEKEKPCPMRASRKPKRLIEEL
ncbi:hypothetical protein NDU88_001279 [Pleurodeles waltl]|uniref:Uncharacterized protein n=1 Tax=Pleurodeles waltl TaxID=8319 RepID=A0AAV7S7L5_PLEWA|nr:hypothetical protein NDU88_001279 [Pleurodeles waltl]